MIWHQALIGRGQNIFPYQQERKSNQKYQHTTGIYEQGGTHQQEQTTYRNIGAAAAKTTTCPIGKCSDGRGHEQRNDGRCHHEPA